MFRMRCRKCGNEWVIGVDSTCTCMKLGASEPIKLTEHSAVGLAAIGLRDYFAGQAINGLLSNPKLAPHILKQGGAMSGWIEDSAYAFADAMLKAREMKP